ncbi:uncharacterized protein LOC107220195 [Neodiprion lecontei]|uniref:Uncharacterized protein LOC107220195 n=1 Tax=Neodiprion lecontei TaxID=441921 RepID=A0A6J0BIV8_NEOLC|nr:uncharacterized protein LOC107220195 [Neodiprion lecontei]
MEHNRIQKLLLSEYCDFSDTVLVESPFAQTTRDGRGLREVALGLTPSRLVVAADILNENSDFMCPPDLDPSIESFELVSVYPLEFVALSIFRRRRRRTLKARLIDGRANYYELGGMERREMFWNIWCERIQNIIAQKGGGSSLSETTAASSSSASTLFLVSSEVELARRLQKRGDHSICRVWAHYGGAGDGLAPSWPQKDLFLGPSHGELGYGYYAPVPVRFAGASLADLRYELIDGSPERRPIKRGCYSWPVGQNFRADKSNHQSGGLCDVLFTRDKNFNFTQGIRVDDLWTTEFTEDSADVGNSAPKKLGRHSTAQKIINLAPKISRFGFGIRENCRSGLYLESYDSRKAGDAAQPPHMPSDPYKLVESGVVAWESGDRRKDNEHRRKSFGRHPRRYGLATAAHFLHALGPWSVQPGERDSVQRRRSMSAVGVRRQPIDPELRLPVSRRQLAASISATALDRGRCGAMGATTRGRVVLFWTPEYWYRPRAATAAYRELRQHLELLREFRSQSEREQFAGNRRTFFGRRKRSSLQSDTGVFATNDERAGHILGRIFSSQVVTQPWKRKKNQGGPSRGGATTDQLRRLLKMDFRVSAWDLDSTTIAHQLTLVDRDLFLRIPPVEMEIIVFQGSSKNASNLGAWIAFSHRISCLVASEILAVKKVEFRARLVARLINAAGKSHATGNFQSCRSILAGLQSPPIYRLKATWDHLRAHHATRYQAMEQLSKIYRSPRTQKYRRTWARAELDSPALPYVGDLLARLLGITSDSRPANTPAVKSLVRKELSASSSPDVCDDANLEQPKPCVGFARRIISAAIVKLKNGKAGSLHCNLSGDGGAWNTRQRILARMAYDRWRSYVIELGFIAQNELNLRNMDERQKRVIEVTAWLTECQRSAQNYSYLGHSIAWEFLLKARYREDRDNFFVSLKLEPPASACTDE